MKLKHGFIYIFLVIFFTLILSACGQNSSSGENGDKTVKIGYQKGNTLNILKENGYLDERLAKDGYKVEWIEFESGTTLLEALSTGNIDYGNAADGPGIFAQATGKELVYTGASIPNLEGVGTMVKQDSDIQTYADLKGKKVAVFKGGNHHYLALLAIEQEGLTEEDIEWVYTSDASQGRAAFESGEVDALATWDPFFAGVEESLKPKTLKHNLTPDDYPNRTFYYATKEFADQHPDLVEAILEETDRSDQYSNKHKKEVAAQVAQIIGIDVKVMERAIDRREYGVDRITPEIVEAQQKEADDFYRFGIIEKKVDVSVVMPIDPEWKPKVNSSEGEDS